MCTVKIMVLNLRINRGVVVFCRCAAGSLLFWGHVRGGVCGRYCLEASFCTSAKSLPVLCVGCNTHYGILTGDLKIFDV